MNIGNDKALRLYLNKLLSQLDDNVLMSEIWIDFLLTPDPLCEHETFLTYQKKLNTSKDKTYQRLFLDAIEGASSVSLEAYIEEGIKAIDVSVYQSNPYYQTVKPKPKSYKDWEITYDDYLPYQPFLYGDVKVKPNVWYQEITPIGFSSEPFHYLAIKQDSITWMSVTPFEIETMQPIIHSLKGHVVALGLGLGYFAFMASLKQQVSHVTIIEKDEKAIKLFHDHLFPFFPYKDKLTIIHQDAFDYLKNPKEHVDHLFVDIYHTAEDGLPLYIKIKPYENLWDQATWSYWLESSILARYRRLILVLLDHVVHSKTKPTFSKLESELRLQLSSLYKKYEGITLHTIESLDAMLSDQRLKTSLIQE